jgi:predicted ABC-type ATPase
VVVLAGPNGAGKTTVAPVLLNELLGVTEFVNADTLAGGLSGFAPERAALAAGRVMLARLHELARQRRSFAFETTLASRSFAPWLARLKQGGYAVHVVFLWLPAPEIALERVAARVRLGGHSIPDETVKRRFHSGLRNFFRLYQALANTWWMYDNSGGGRPTLVARGSGRRATEIADARRWRTVTRMAYD